MPAWAGVGVTVIETVAEAPLASTPSGQVIVPAAFVHAAPCDEVIVPITTPAGSVLTYETPEAELGPAFETVAVYVTGTPLATGEPGVDESVVVMSDDGWTTVELAPVLFPAAGSCSFAATVAELAIEPAIAAAAFGRTTITTVAFAPGAIVPIVQTSGDAESQLPWLGVTEMRAALAGSVSVSVTPVAGERFEFEIVTVYVSS